MNLPFAAADPKIPFGPRKCALRTLIKAAQTSGCFNKWAGLGETHTRAPVPARVPSSRAPPSFRSLSCLAASVGGFCLAGAELPELPTYLRTRRTMPLPVLVPPSMTRRNVPVGERSRARTRVGEGARLVLRRQRLRWPPCVKNSSPDSKRWEQVPVLARAKRFPKSLRLVIRVSGCVVQKQTNKPAVGSICPLSAAVVSRWLTLVGLLCWMTRQIQE